MMTEATWQELKDLRDSGQLIPGMKYRMIDYDTYTSQEGTESAMHPFDLILTALDNKTLSEECSAIHSARDVDGYFANSNLGAWKVSYCLDNDISRFNWAADELLSIKVGGQVFNCAKATMPNISLLDESGNPVDGVEPYIVLQYGNEGGLDFYMCVDANVVVGENPTYLLYYNGTDNPIDFNAFVIQPHSGIMMALDVVNVSAVNKSDIVGKGVIYRLFDKELNNDIYYDFKNIRFKTESGDYYWYTMGSNVEKDDSYRMGNIKITMKPLIGGYLGVCLTSLGWYRLDPRGFDGASMSNITIKDCPKIDLYTMEGEMSNLYFENCSLDCKHTNEYFRYMKDSTFKNVSGSLVFSNSANKYNNLDVDGALPIEGVYDGSVKTYIRAKSNGSAFAYTDNDLYNALNK